MKDTKNNCLLCKKEIDKPGIFCNLDCYKGYKVGEVNFVEFFFIDDKGKYRIVDGIA